MRHTGAHERMSAVVATAVLLLTGVGVGPAGGGTGGPTGAEAEPVVDAQVERELRSSGETDFWVHFGERPDLTPYTQIEDWAARGEAVHQALTSTADRSQAEVRAMLDAEGVEYRSFYATNAIKVSGGDGDLLADLLGDEAVAGVYSTFEVTPPDPVTQVTGEVAPAQVAWGVADINADDVWAQGITGKGIVVASIDTGVQFDHPALLGHYRGRSADGTVSHAYSWFDPTGGSSTRPRDRDGHGTHVTGTMVGGVGAEQIGVAPGATWIAANGCCPNDAALLESMQWMLAPTDLNGRNPRPALRPHVVNNSWGTTGPSTDPFGEDISQAWAGSGIFGVFANGNTGSGCRTSASPGSRAANYSVGNYTRAHRIAASSARGAGQGGAVKPDIAAPGTGIRSAFPGGGYVELSGTSMAAPHVAGAVALLWSAAPSVKGDVAATRALLDGSAVNTADNQCGGTAGNNNVYGEGRLDALALVRSAPTPPAVVRLSGADRYATAATISGVHRAGVGTVFVATGADYPDALAVAARAASVGAPVLLTKPTVLPEATRRELVRLAPTDVVVVGGTRAVSTAVLRAIDEATGSARVSRWAGEDRFATAALVAAEFGTAPVVYVATGRNYPDALAGAARAGALDGPVLLVEPGRLPAATDTALRSLQPSQIRVLGGTSAVSDTVVRALRTHGTVTRVSGDDRYATAVTVSADYRSAQRVYLSSGQNWPDALAGAARAGSQSAPVLLTRQDSLPGVTRTELDRLDPSTVYLLGGTSAVATAVERALGTLR